MRHILKIELKEDYRCLKKGNSFEASGLNLLVGDQGCGKSSLLHLLNNHGRSKNATELSIILSEDARKNSVETFYFDTEKDNPRIKDSQLYSTPDGRDRGIGVKAALFSKFQSHGEVLREFTVEAIPTAKDCILFIDEPESALSLKNQFKLVREIHKAVDRNVQVFAATHCLPLIESTESVFSVEEFKWVKSAQFIELQHIHE